MNTLIILFFGLKFWQLKPPFWIYDWNIEYFSIVYKEEISSTEDLINNVVYFINNEQYDRALSSINSYILSSESVNDTLLFLKAELNYYNEEMDTSLYYLRRLKYSNVPYFKKISDLDIGWIHIYKKQYDQAVSVFDRVESLNDGCLIS